jgi:hypothetical protein
MLLLSGATYLQPSILAGRQALHGVDYEMLHARRIAFARDALFGPRHTLPAWYPRELGGSPFAANLQSFPWIPTRLVLLLFDPELAYAAGVALAAMLAALFTYLYGRRAGLSLVAAAAAGWTFACAGFFASRVTAGHLPLLEAYPALPILLWLVDRALEGRRRDLVALAFAAACISVAGHPQVPAYALGAAMLYALWLGRGWMRARIAAVLALGAAAAAVLWWPMVLLIGRSTRVLPLAPADNDIAMPYSRLLALLSPGIHGWPDALAPSAQHPFDRFPNEAWFWDTADYIGLLPLAAILALLVLCLVRRCRPDARWLFLGVLGTGALLCSLPLIEPLRTILPGTLLRSPARLLYLSTFAAAAAFGAGLDALAAIPRIGSTAVALCLLVHAVDLGGFTRLFTIAVPRPPKAPFQAVLAREVGDGRIAADQNLDFTYPAYDDAGGFDSIFLARPYRALLALNGSPPDLNEQLMNGAEYSVAALRAFGVRFVITESQRSDLPEAAVDRDTHLYRVPDPVPRAAAAGGVAYSRPSSDEILLETSAPQLGVAHVLEAWDPGWSATVDGAAPPVILDNGFSMAVPVPAGAHHVRMLYRTAGRMTGALISLVALAVLSLLVRQSGKLKSRVQAT